MAPNVYNVKKIVMSISTESISAFDYESVELISGTIWTLLKNVEHKWTMSIGPHVGYQVY